MNYCRLCVSLFLVTFASPSVAVDFVPTRSVVYKTVGDVELKMDLFEPEGLKATDRRPAIVFFFGGGWSGGR